MKKFSISFNVDDRHYAMVRSRFDECTEDGETNKEVFIKLVDYYLLHRDECLKRKAILTSVLPKVLFTFKFRNSNHSIVIYNEKLPREINVSGVVFIFKPSWFYKVKEYMHKYLLDETVEALVDLETSKLTLNIISKGETEVEKKVVERPAITITYKTKEARDRAKNMLVSFKKKDDDSFADCFDAILDKTSEKQSETAVHIKECLSMLENPATIVQGLCGLVSSVHPSYNLSNINSDEISWHMLQHYPVRVNVLYSDGVTEEYRGDSTVEVLVSEMTALNLSSEHISDFLKNVRQRVADAVEESQYRFVLDLARVGIMPRRNELTVSISVGGPKYTKRFMFFKKPHHWSEYGSFVILVG